MHPFEAKVISNERLTPNDHFQDVRLIKLQIDESFRYSPGDVCLIYPENYAESVDEFFALTNLDANESIFVKKKDENWFSETMYDHLPQPCSIRALVTSYLDINSIPKK